MPFTTTNDATAADASLVAVLGMRAYFREAPVTGGDPFHDFGHVRSPSREQDLTELEIKSARLGRLATIKKLTTDQSLEYTFDSISVLDAGTIGYHTGGDSGVGAVGADDIYAVEDFNATEGQLLFVQENAETGGIVKVAFYPKAQIKGDGEESGDGESESALTFRATILQDENYTVPVALAAGEPAAPYGFRYFSAYATLQTVLDEIAGTAV